MLTSITPKLRHSRSVAGSLFAAAILMPGVASATVWPGRVSDTNVEVSYSYDDVAHTLTLDWIELPPAGPPVIAGDGAMTLTIWNNSGVQTVDIDLDWEALFDDPTYVFSCSNSACSVNSCTPQIGSGCELVEAPGNCTYPNMGCADIIVCADYTCGVDPDPPAPPLHLPWAIGPYQPDGSSLFPG